MQLANRLEAAIARFFFAERAMHALVLARVIFGVVLFLCYLNRWPDLQQLYGPEGLLGAELATHAQTEDVYGKAPAFAVWGDLLRTLAPPRTEAGIFALTAALMLSSLSFALGFFTRTSGVVALLLHHFFVVALLPFSYWGWSVHIQPLMAYTIFAPTGRVWSIDAWLARRRRGEAQPASAWLAAAWPLRLLQIHTATMYAVAAWSRFDDTGWLGGEAVFEAVTVALHAKFAINWHPFRLPLEFATYASLLLESAAPIFLWVPRVGVWLAYGLMGMHLGLELLSNLGWWSHIMIASLLCFVPVAHLVWVFEHLPRWVRPNDVRVDRASLVRAR